MDAFFTFLSDHRSGIFMLFVGLATLGLLIDWMAWIFGFGRFKGRGSATAAGDGNPVKPIRYVMAELLAEIINDFRHLLALVIIFVFALVLFLAMWPGLSDMQVDTMTDGVQGVVAALGGLIGSIIGYYFGESAATKRRGDSGPPPGEPPEVVQDSEETPEVPTKPAKLKKGDKSESEGDDESPSEDVT